MFKFKSYNFKYILICSIIYYIMITSFINIFSQIERFYVVCVVNRSYFFE